MHQNLKKKLKQVSTLLLILAVLTIPFLNNIKPAQATLLPLHVDGTHLKDSIGNIVILRGVAYVSYEWWASGYLNENQFIYMHNMGCTCVTIHVTAWDIDAGCLSNPAFWTALDNIMNWAETHELYVILRGFGFFGTCTHGIPNNHLNHYFTVDHTWADWIDVFELYATRYAARIHIIYELLVEPLYVSYSDYQTHIRDCIDAIRAIDSDAVISVPAVSSGDYPNQLLFEQTYPISRSNIVFNLDLYGTTTYPDTNQAAIRNMLSYLGAEWCLNNGRCVIHTEYGGYEGHPWSTYGAFNTAWLASFFAISDADGYAGYTAWAWYAGNLETNDFPLISNWSGTLTAYGVIIRNYYLTYPPLPPSPPPPITPTLLTPTVGATLTNYLVHFTWTFSIGATDYQIQVIGPTDYDQIVYTNSFNATVSNGLYTWRVRSHNGTGYSVYSALRSFTMAVPTPSPTPSPTPTPEPSPTWISGLFNVMPIFKAENFRFLFFNGTAWRFQNGFNKSIVFTVEDGKINSSKTDLILYSVSGRFKFFNPYPANLSFQCTNPDVDVKLNNQPWENGTRTLRVGWNEIRYGFRAGEWFIDLPLLIGIFGLILMFIGPILGIMYLRKREYHLGLVFLLIVTLIGFSLVLSWLLHGS